MGVRIDFPSARKNELASIGFTVLKRYIPRGFWHVLDKDEQDTIIMTVYETVAEVPEEIEDKDFFRTLGKAIYKTLKELGYYRPKGYPGYKKRAKGGLNESTKKSKTACGIYP